MHATLFVGLDVGTTASKAVVVTGDGTPVTAGRATTPWTAAGTEADAVTLLDAARSAVADALTNCPPGTIAGVGVAGIAESGVLLDGRGEPVAPVIAWHDTRDDAELEDLRSAVGAQRFSATTGLPFRQQWSLTKHRWLVDNVASARAAVRRLNVGEWIVRGFGGEEATEQSLASRTGWLRLAERDWWDETLAWSGAARSLLPPLVTAGTPLGRVSSAVGLPRLTGAVLTVAGHDHQAAAVGAGADGPGDELDSCGTAEALVRTIAPGLPRDVVADLASAGITTGWHALADHWCLLGATQGGLALQRILAELYMGRTDLAELDSGTSGAARRWRAEIDTVTEQAATIHDAMNAVSGPHRRLIVTGGWSRSAAFLAAKRRRFGAFEVSDVDEAGARGAALLAARAAESAGVAS